MASRNLKYVVYVLIGIIVVSLIIYPSAQTTGKQVTISQKAVIGNPQVNIDKCSNLELWQCIFTLNCVWDQGECEVATNCQTLNFEDCSASPDCRWALDYNGRPFTCRCVEDDGSRYVADICYNCQKDPLEDGVDCGGVCKKGC